MKKSVRFASPSPTQRDSSDAHHSRTQLNKNNINKNTKQYPVQTDIIDILTPASLMSESDRASQYWQLKDYEYFRGTAQIIATEVLKVTNSQPPSSHSYNNVLTRAYDLCAIVSEASYSKTNGDTDGQDENEDGCHNLPSPSSTTCTAALDQREKKKEEEEGVILPPHLFAALTHWVKAGHSRRGLEKFCVTSHIRSRPMAKAATVQAVLLAQDLLRQQALQKQAPLKPAAVSTTEKKHPRNCQTAPAPCDSSNETTTTKTRTATPKKFHIGTSEFPLENMEQDEILRLVSERFSKTSRYYGVSIGHADAAAIGNYQHPGLKK